MREGDDRFPDRFRDEFRPSQKNRSALCGKKIGTIELFFHHVVN